MGWPSALKQKRERKKLEKALGRFDLPSFPQVVQELMAKLRDPRSSASDLGELVTRDPALSVAVLKTVNSTAFATRRRIVDLQQAVALVGRSNLESILVSVGVGRALAGAGAGADLGRFWVAAARRATLAKAVAQKTNPPEATLAYTAALLSDVAVPLLSAKFDAHRELTDRWRAGGCPDLCEAEREQFGWDHAEVGGWLCTAWALPEEISDAIRNHHLAGDECPAPVHMVAFVGEELPLQLDEPMRAMIVDRLGGRLVDDSALPAEEAAELIEQRLTHAEDLAASFR